MLSTANTDILQIIGNTPLVKLSKIVPENCADIFVKLEYFNPTGSYKDRMANAIIEQAELRGDITKEIPIVEFTGGSTGTSLAFVCAVKGYRFTAVTSDAFAKEKLQTIKLFGASLEIVPCVDGQITPDLFIRMREKTNEFRSRGYYWTNQFENRDAELGYHVMGQEMIDQVDARIDVFCAAVGTAGMLTGVSSVLRKAVEGIKVVALEP